MADESSSASPGEQAAKARRQERSGHASAPSGAEARPRSSGGFFTVYKSGQGYWTRMGTAIGGLLVIAWTAYFLYKRTYGSYPAHATAIFWSAIGVFALLGLLVWWIINKPTNADFLIATDGEMKKVNWASRQELIGSTKVVILFMFLIAAILFLVDIAFGYFFYMINVLKAPPF